MLRVEDLRRSGDIFLTGEYLLSLCFFLSGLCCEGLFLASGPGRLRRRRTGDFAVVGYLIINKDVA